MTADEIESAVEEIKTILSWMPAGQRGETFAEAVDRVIAKEKGKE